MNKEKLIVCDKCYHSNLDGGQFLGEVWCDNCESWNTNLIEVPKSEALKMRKKIEKEKRK